MRDPLALVSVGLGLKIAAGFVLCFALVAALVFHERHRASTGQEISHELEQQEDAWAGFIAAKQNHPPLSEMEVRDA